MIMKSQIKTFITLGKFESKRSRTYEFIVNTGLRYKLAILELCRRFIRTEEFPESFNLTTLVQLPKQGSQLVLDNLRFLHIKSWGPRLVKALTV